MEDFDRVAPFYDRLANMVFGQQLGLAQSHYLTQVSEKDCVLIIGGGTGRILEDLPVIPHRLDFVEPSEGMISRAKTRLSQGVVSFSQCRFEDFTSDELYDLIVSPFYWDMYPERVFPHLLAKVSRLLSSQGCLIATDFVHPKNLRQSVTLRAMYTFFQVMAGLKAKTLPRWQQLILGNGFELRESVAYCSGFVESCVFVRSSQKDA